jgi:outer membrane protein TolC
MRSLRFLSVLALVAGALAPVAARAQAAAGELTLAAAMAQARQRGYEVAAADARVEAARQQERQAAARRLPVVRLQEIWMRTDSPAEAFALTLNQERFSFPDFVAGDPNRPRAVESATTRLEVEVPLYTGGELTARIRQAGLATEAAGALADRAADAAALAAAEAYLLVAQAEERVELLERSLATVRAHVALAGAHVEQGMLVRSELLRARVEAARLEDLLSEARGQAQVSRAALAYRLADPDAGGGRIAPLPAPAPLSRALDEWLAAARRRPDLEAARHGVAAMDLEARARGAAGRPRVGLVARGDLVDDSPFGDHGDSTTVLAQASWDLFAGGRHRAAAAAARAEAAAAHRQLEQAEHGVEVEVRQAWVAATSARERHATSLAAVAAARENERILEERFARGVVKTLDLLDATTARRETETRELVARAEADLAGLRLAVAAGEDPETAIP